MYYLDKQGEPYYKPSKEQILTLELEEMTSPIWESKALLLHQNIGVVAKKEDGSYYEYYNIDGTPDLNREQKELIEKTKTEKNTPILAEIQALEMLIIRPIREMLSTTVLQSDKDIAQLKINDIESRIQALRVDLI
jgi:hypothetical protein